jgi:hypothetical protein
MLQDDDEWETHVQVPIIGIAKKLSISLQSYSCEQIATWHLLPLTGHQTWYIINPEAYKMQSRLDTRAGIAMVSWTNLLAMGKE